MRGGRREPPSRKERAEGRPCKGPRGRSTPRDGGAAARHARQPPDPGAQKSDQAGEPGRSGRCTALEAVRVGGRLFGSAVGRTISTVEKLTAIAAEKSGLNIHKLKRSAAERKYRNTDLDSTQEIDISELSNIAG